MEPEDVLERKDKCAMRSISAEIRPWFIFFNIAHANQQKSPIESLRCAIIPGDEIIGVLLPYQSTSQNAAAADDRTREGIASLDVVAGVPELSTEESFL